MLENHKKLQNNIFKDKNTKNEMKTNKMLKGNKLIKSSYQIPPNLDFARPRAKQKKENHKLKTRTQKTSNKLKTKI